MKRAAEERLLETLLATGRRSVTVVGTAKNVGKTVTVAALVTAAARRGLRVGIASSGRDGERRDAVDSRAKPALVLPAGTLVATAAALVPVTPAPRVLDVGEESALGPLAIVALRSTASCEVTGPSSAAALRRIIARLHAFGAELAIVDGAVDRIASLGGSEDAAVLATGVASGATPEGIAAVARDAVERLRIPCYDAGRDGPALALPGALTYEVARRLLDENETRVVVVDDATHVMLRGGAFARIAERLRVRVARRAQLVACTVASGDGTVSTDPRALIRAVAASARVPAFDLYADLCVDAAAA